jgi:hypothetical protein
METLVELRSLRERLANIKKESNRLFAAQVELKLNHSLIIERQEEIFMKDQELEALRNFIEEEFY